MLFGVGSQYASPNCEHLTVLNTGAVSWDIHDGTAAVKYIRTGAVIVDDSATHTFVVGNIAGTLSMYIDGVLQSLSPAGAGTGIVTALATCTIGYDTTPYVFNGYVSKVVQGRTYQEVLQELAKA
jgi:hypothetical protein